MKQMFISFYYRDGNVRLPKNSMVEFTAAVSNSQSITQQALWPRCQFNAFARVKTSLAMCCSMK